ncbi:rubrerythrin family protein [Candidatus Micrarchaeota archaeon]|nr:rubrerythrin family protein [Candidatus Micrarchaeota archaeon]
MSKTLENLVKAFIGESMARNRYTLFASVARKEGYEQIAEIFLLTADNEFEHAEWHFKNIQELKDKENVTDLEINTDANAPIKLGTTEENLNSAVEGEDYETTTMYPKFADIADEEGYHKIAVRLRAVAKAEEHHRERFKKILEIVKTGTVFKKNEKKYWVCRKCGYVHYGEEPPEKCPSCYHSKNYFQLECEEY